MNLTQRARIVEAFLVEIGDPDLVMVGLYPHRTTVHTTSPLPGFTYESERTKDATHHAGTAVRDGLVIELIAVDLDEEVTA